MEKIFVKARAKINLNLIVLGKREDGYHNIKSVFQKVNLYDELFLSKTDTADIELVTNKDEINNPDNIICKAYYKLKEKFDISGVKVKLNKKIPMQAGMGGGSADCASFIIAMNKLFDIKMSQKEMEEIGRELGADVVPCLYDGAVLAEGIGEIITPIDAFCKFYLVIIKPQMNCNTKEMYKKIDEKATTSVDTTTEIINGIKTNNINQISANLYNSFEDVIENVELIKNIKNELLKNGALGSLMTGSGSCVFGIFEHKNEAKKAFETLRKAHETYICTSFGKNV
jgi:4-diphosphocytidyl-2-C-methyl-D-erythritol kinase